VISGLFAASSATIASSGTLRLPNSDNISWRNAANTGDLSIRVDSADDLIFDNGSTTINLTATAAGNVNGPASATDNAIVRFDSTTGQVIQDSLVTISDTGEITGPSITTTSGTITTLDAETITLGSDDINVETAINDLSPIGSIISHYDFNGAIALPSNYAYCDGSVVTDTDSPLLGMTLPDLSNRYMVGYGSEAGTDIGTATFDAAAVGTPFHEANLQHDHTVPPHTHVVNSHSHDLDRSNAHALVGSTGDDIFLGEELVSPSYIITNSIDGTTGSFIGTSSGRGAGVQGRTEAETGATSPSALLTSSNGLTTNFDIQPRSIRVRFAIRIK